MNNCIYKISIRLDKSQLDIIYSSLSSLEKQHIYCVNTDSSFYYDMVDEQIGYLITSPQEMKEYENILSSNLIPYICENMSSYVLENKIDLELILDEFVDPTNYSEYDVFVNLLNKWILNNLNLDSILDRISDNGIQTIRPIDKEFLKNIKW